MAIARNDFPTVPCIVGWVEQWARNWRLTIHIGQWVWAVVAHSSAI